MFRKILKGVKVLDFTHVGAGPMCTMLLGDMGAEIIKVEPPGGELGRKLGPGWIGEDCTAYYGFNRNKQSIVIDLKKEQGRDLARQLCANAQIVVESLRPGVMDRLGLGYERLAETRPDLIYCSISAYGQSGPFSERPGVDGILQADTGLMSLIGHPDVQEPCKVQAPIVDVTTGYVACMSILAKLLDKTKGGVGGHIDVSLMNAALVLQQTTLTNFFHQKSLPQPLGSAAPYSAPNEAFQTQDGWIMIAAYNGDRWTRLCDAVDISEFTNDERLASSSSRVENRQFMRQILNDAFRKRKTAYWMDKLRSADILCAKVAQYSDVELHPQAIHNSIFTSFDHPEFGPIKTVGFPVNSMSSNAQPHDMPPSCGQHSREILEKNGFSAEQIETYYTADIIK
ncbi:MAG: CaiB/BaiF CoA transferase family protein [Advenella sp.]